MNVGEYDNFQQVLDIIHSKKIKYLILRNYDNLLMPDMYQDGHGDVDMLCEDSELLAREIGAKYFIRKDGTIRADKTHFFITISNKIVSLDLRSIGDGYYCLEWERDMLKKRILHNGFYIMDEENQFYSLVYHAILQKRELSTEYQTRLNKMKNNLNLKKSKDFSEFDFIKTLEVFMKERGYMYTYAEDICVPLRIKCIDKKLIKKDFNLRYNHWKFDNRVRFIEFLVNIKHKLEQCFH